MSTEAGRRYEYFSKLCGGSVSGVNGAGDVIMLLKAIFDPIPEPEPVKSLGQMLYDIQGGVDWSEQSSEFRERCEADASAFIAAHEARRPKPTIYDVAKKLCEAPPYLGNWDKIGLADQNEWLAIARAVFPLFGVTP